MGIRLTPIRSAAALACLLALAAGPAVDTGLTGVWKNPNSSVHVAISPCRDAICGIVVWASDKANEDARRGGTPALVGTNLLRDFVQRPDGSWRGKVFVPDLARTVSGTLRMTGEDTLSARSCALGIVCRTQVWTRLR